MNTLDIAISCGLAPKRAGHEYHSPCPMCGGNDRFIVWPEKGEAGAWYCRGCRKGGDAVQLLIEAKGMSFKEACAALGKEAPTRQRARGPRPPKQLAPDFVPREPSAPAELWQARASAFAEASHAELLKTPEQLSWLAARGITEETARRFRLGWNPKPFFRKRPTWGLEIKKEMKDGVEKVKEWMCLPAGLVIPYQGERGIIRLRIRKPEGEPRYFVAPGSGMAPMMIPPMPPAAPGRAAWVMVESEIDAILIAQEAGDIIGAAALGSVAVKPDGALYAALKGGGAVLVALDFDAAGAKFWPWWREHFPQADRWPVPAGKDPGDYRKAGGDIRAWILAGLPPGLRPVSKEIIPDALRHSGQFGKKSNLWISGVEEGGEVPPPAQQGVETSPFPKGGQRGIEDAPEADPLTGYAMDDAPCSGCGKTLTQLWPEHARRPRATCAACLGENPWEKIFEKDFKRQPRYLRGLSQ